MLSATTVAFAAVFAVADLGLSYLDRALVTEDPPGPQRVEASARQDGGNASKIGLTQPLYLPRRVLKSILDHTSGHAFMRLAA